MNKTLKMPKREELPQLPFNEALKQVWASPPQPKIAKKKAQKK
jgi:hypothetical protein